MQRRGVNNLAGRQSGWGSVAMQRAPYCNGSKHSAGTLDDVIISSLLRQGSFGPLVLRGVPSPLTLADPARFTNLVCPRSLRTVVKNRAWGWEWSRRLPGLLGFRETCVLFRWTCSGGLECSRKLSGLIVQGNMVKRCTRYLAASSKSSGGIGSFRSLSISIMN